MTKIDRFMAAVMGFVQGEIQVEDILTEEISFIPRPWSPSSNGEISYEVRKWFQEHEPEVWEGYLEYIWDKRVKEEPIFTNTLRYIFSIQNFYRYLVEHFDEWGYEDCPEYTHNVNILECDQGLCRNRSGCDHTGRICKYPEAEKMLREG